MADAHVLLIAEIQQFGAGAERIRHRRRVWQQLGVSGPVVVQDEPAADRVVGSLTQHLAVAVRGEGHAVGVERQRAATIQNQIVFRIKCDWVRAIEPQLPGSLDLVGTQRAACGVNGFWILPLQAPQHGVVAAVAMSGCAQRAEQLGANLCGTGE